MPDSEVLNSQPPPNVATKICIGHATATNWLPMVLIHIVDKMAPNNDKNLTGQLWIQHQNANGNIQSLKPELTVASQNLSTTTVTWQTPAQPQRFKCNRRLRKYHQQMSRMMEHIQLQTDNKRKGSYPSLLRNETANSLPVTTTHVTTQQHIRTQKKWMNGTEKRLCSFKNGVLDWRRKYTTNQSRNGSSEGADTYSKLLWDWHGN